MDNEIKEKKELMKMLAEKYQEIYQKAARQLFSEYLSADDLSLYISKLNTVSFEIVKLRKEEEEMLNAKAVNEIIYSDKNLAEIDLKANEEKLTLIDRELNRISVQAKYSLNNEKDELSEWRQKYKSLIALKKAQENYIASLREKAKDYFEKRNGRPPKYPEFLKEPQFPNESENDYLIKNETELATAREKILENAEKLIKESVKAEKLKKDVSKNPMKKPKKK